MGAVITETRFGARIRAARAERGVTLRALARTTNVTAGYLSMVERGEYSPPGVDTIKLMAQALELDSDVLLAAAGKIAPDLVDLIIARPLLMAGAIRELAHWSDRALGALCPEDEL